MFELIPNVHMSCNDIDPRLSLGFTRSAAPFCEWGFESLAWPRSYDGWARHIANAIEVKTVNRESSGQSDHLDCHMEAQFGSHVAKLELHNVNGLTALV